MNHEVENHGGSTETPTNKKSKKGWRKVLEEIGSWLSYENKDEWLKDMRGNLGLIATVIATMTFQMVLNPPGGIWSLKDEANPLGGVWSMKDDSNLPSPNANPPSPNYSLSEFQDRICTEVENESLCAGQAVLAIVNSSGYFLFLISNTICFISSLSICLLLVSGIRLHHRVIMWLLSIGMCVTLTSLALSYITAVRMTTPNLDYYTKAAQFIITGSLSAWMGLLAIIGMCHTLRLVIWASSNKNVGSLGPRKKYDGKD